MVRASITHCPRKHEYNEANTQWTIGVSGKLQRSCKRCKVENRKAKYAKDPVFREKMKARCRKNNRLRRGTKGTQIPGTHSDQPKA